MEETADIVQLRSVVQQLVQQVTELKLQIAEGQVSDRLDGLEEQLLELATEVRLQARRSSIASQLQLSLLHSNTGSAAASPRVAGPMSACTTPQSAVLPFESNKAAIASPRKTAAAHMSTGGSKMTDANSVPGSSSGCTHDSSRHGGKTGLRTALVVGSPWPGSEVGQQLGAFSTMQGWGEGVLGNSNDELKRQTQLVEAAQAAAAEAQSAAGRCQQQVLELRGRQGQAERRLDTLWQLQEAAGKVQAAVGRTQQDLQQNQQQLLRQHHNMSAMQAQILQLDARCDSNNATSSQLQHALQDMQQQVDGMTKDASESREQIQLQQQAVGALKAEFRAEVHQLEQGLQQQSTEQQQALAECSKAAKTALDKCEQLRQAAAVANGRLDGTPGQIQAAVQPLLARLGAVDAALSTWTAAAAQLGTVVQQSQLTAAVGQLSSSWTRQAHEHATRLAGVIGRLELLEGVAARQEQVVLQEEFKRYVAQLHSDLEVAILQATGPLQKQITSKADVSQLNNSRNHLEAKLTSSEKTLLQGLKCVSDKTALLLQHKAELAAFDALKQQVAEDMLTLRSQLQAVQHWTSELHAAHARAALAAPQAAAITPTGMIDGIRRDASEQSALKLFSALLGGATNVAGSEATATCLYGPNVGISSPALLGQQRAGSQQGSGLCLSAAEAALSREAPAALISAAAKNQAGAAVIPPPGSPPDAAFETNGGSSTGRGVAATVVRPLSKHPNSSPAAAQRRNAIHPWSGNPSPIVGELHSAAHNAKLAQAARGKEALRAKVLHCKGLRGASMLAVPAPAPEEVADALQQQLSILGVSTTASAAGDSGQPAQKQGVINAAPYIAALAAAAVSMQDSIDGTGGLIATTAVGLEGSGQQACTPGPARQLTGVGALSGTAIKFSLNQQSAMAASSSTNQDAGSTADMLITSNLGATPARSTGSRMGGSSAATVQQQLDQQVTGQSPSPTAEHLRLMLRGSSAGASKVMAQLGQGRISSVNSTARKKR